MPISPKHYSTRLLSLRKEPLRAGDVGGDAEFMSHAHHTGSFDLSLSTISENTSYWNGDLRVTTAELTPDGSRLAMVRALRQIADELEGDVIDRSAKP